MTISKYCKQQDFTLEEYREYKEQIKQKALKVYEKATELHAIGTGIYYPLDEILEDSIETPFIIQELKALDVEFWQRESFIAYRLA